MTLSGNFFSDSIMQARQGPAACSARLLEPYRDYLRLLARTSMTDWMHGKADPSDLVQETLIKAVDHFREFRGETEVELAAWLRSILVQHLTDLARRYRTAKRFVAQEVSLDELVEQSSRTYCQLLAGQAKTPSQLAHQRDLGVVLTEALSDLSDDQREAIVLRSLEQLPWDEVGRRIERSPDAARMLWARALKSLRGKIKARL